MAKTKKVLVLTNGREYEITGDNGRFWVCGNTQFRKANPMIAEIKKVKAPAEEKPAKKKAAKGE